jgi:hypothetical protein
MHNLRRLSHALAAVVVAALGLTMALPASAALGGHASTPAAASSVPAVVVSNAVLAAHAAPAATPNIVGGQPASQPYPFEGTLLYDHSDGQGPRFHCDLSLVAKIDGTSWFASNAHCGTVELQPTLLPTSALRVTLGSKYRSQQTTYPVSRTVDVPYWSWTTPHPGPR